MLNLQEASCLGGRLVNSKGPHDPESGGAFQRADKADVAVEEMRLPRPMRHLPGIQEVAARMRVEGSAEVERAAQDLAGDLRIDLDVLKGSGDPRGEVTVNIGLGYLSLSRC